MSKPYDATLKVLLEAGPGDWLRLLGRPANHVELVDADVSAVTGAADKVIVVKDEPGWVEHIEFQAGPDESKPQSLHMYGAILEARLKKPVWTTLVLLRKEANLSAYSGTYTNTMPWATAPHRSSNYGVVRVWRMPPADLLGSIATMPLAPIADVTAEEVPSVIDAMKSRMAGIAEPSMVGELWTSTRILLGLKYEREFVNLMLREVQGMEESTTFQEIIEIGERRGEARGEARGRLAEARRLLTLFGRNRFAAEPGADALAALNRLSSIDEIERLCERVGQVSSWAELLNLPPGSQ